ncbi:MAG: TonB-dependent receptor, partial [Gammaproteobacteria bacterium]
FGRATFSGAVNYVTRRPTDAWESEINARYGTHDDRMFGGWLSGPLVADKLLFLASASHEEYGGQWNNNLQPDSAFVPGTTLTGVFGDQNREGDWSPLGEEKTTDVLVKLTWTPASSTEVNVKYSYTKGDDGHFPNNVFDTLNCFIPDDPAARWYLTSRAEFCGEFRIEGTENRKNIPDIRNGMSVTPLLPLPPEQTVSAPAEPGQHRDTQRIYADWIQDIGDWRSELKASLSVENFDAAYDLDHQEVRAVWGLFSFASHDDIDDYSIEYSITSPAGHPVRGKLGLYYYDRELSFRQRSFTGPFAVFGSVPGTDWVDPRVKTVVNTSVFGGVSVDLAERWTLDLEARYAKDEKDITSGQLFERTSESGPVKDSLEFRAFTPRITLNWKPGGDMLIYGLIAKGNKPGGFNEEYFRSDVPTEFSQFLVDCGSGEIGSGLGIPAGTVCTPEFKSKATFAEEEQWTYEVGIKSQWFERRVTANLSAFFIDWTNQSLFALDDVPQRGTGGTTPTTVLENAGKSTVRGLELESSWIVTDTLMLFLNYGYNEGEFEKGTFPELARTTGGDGNISGNTIPDSPRHSAVFGFDASARAGVKTEAFVRADFLLESKRYVGASNLNYIGDRRIANLRAGLRGETWTLTGYVRNLLNDDTPLAVFNFVNFATDPISTVPGADNDGANTLMYALNPQRERDAGVEFTYRFGN